MSLNSRDKKERFLRSNLRVADLASLIFFRGVGGGEFLINLWSRFPNNELELLQRNTQTCSLTWENHFILWTRGVLIVRSQTLAKDVERGYLAISRYILLSYLMSCKLDTSVISSKGPVWRFAVRGRLRKLRIFDRESFTCIINFGWVERKCEVLRVWKVDWSV